MEVERKQDQGGTRSRRSRLEEIIQYTREEIECRLGRAIVVANLQHGSSIRIRKRDDSWRWTS